MMLAALFDRPAVQAGVDFHTMPWPESSNAATWFEVLGTRSDSGITIGPETALTIGVVYRAINVLAHAVATVPLVIYERKGEGKARVDDHPQFSLLHDQPNAWMTSFQFRHLMVSRMILWGNFYAQIIPGFGGISQLAPLDPNPAVTRVVDQLGDGRLVYETRPMRGDRYLEPVRLVQDEMLHVRGFSKDGKVGIPLTTFARNAMGLALAAEKHGSMFMRRGAQLSGVLSSDTVTNDETREANEKAWNRAQGGLKGSGLVPLLEGGWKFSQMTATNKDSQWLEARDFEIAELGPRFLGVPGLLCGYPEKTATYASSEQMRQVFVDTGVMPLTDNIRAELTRSVVTGERYYADFVLEGLLRGDIKTRYEAHRIAIMTGWKSRQEARRIEGDNPGPPELEEFYEPTNMGKAGEEPGGVGSDGTPPRRSQQPPQDDAEARRMRGIVGGVVDGLVRREVAAIVGNGTTKGAARRYAKDAKGWGAWLTEFYEGHAKTVSERLRVPWDTATSYCAARAEALAGGLEGAEDFEATGREALLAIANGGV